MRDYLRTDVQPNPEPSDVTGSLPKWLKKGERRAEPLTAFVTPTVNALSFWEDNWLSLAQVPLVVAWQPKLISKDEVLRIAANIAKLLGAYDASAASRADQVNRILEPIPAGIARPHMPNAMIRQMLRPFRSNDIGTTLRTLISGYAIHKRFLSFAFIG